VRDAAFIDCVVDHPGSRPSPSEARPSDQAHGRFELDGVDRQHVKRIWPIVLSGATLRMAEKVYDWIVEESGDHLQQATAQSLTILDMADWEQLRGLLEAGWSAPQLLARNVVRTAASIGAVWSSTIRSFRGHAVVRDGPEGGRVVPSDD
jgi:hypothetical protein